MSDRTINPVTISKANRIILVLLSLFTVYNSRDKFYIDIIYDLNIYYIKQS